MRSAITLLLVLAIGVVGRAAEPPEAAVVGIASIRIAELWDAEAFKSARDTLESKALRFRAEVVRTAGLPPGEIERVTVVVFKIASGDNETTQGPVTVVVPRKPIDVKAVAGKRKEALGKGKIEGLPEFTLYEDEPISRVAISAKMLVLLPWMEPSESRAAMEAAMIAKAVQRDADRAAVLARDKLVASLSVDVPELVRTLSGRFDDEGVAQGVPETLQPMLKARVATVNVSLSKALGVKAELAFVNAEHAAAAKPALELAFKQLQRVLEEAGEGSGVEQLKTVAELQKIAARFLADAAVAVKDRTVTVTASQELTPAFAQAAAQGIVLAESTAAKITSQNNLKQIVLAAHNNENANAAGLLENICDDKGKPLLSWRVRLLPYMEQEKLYQEFKLDEPWDSEHNKKLIPKMPKIFAVPSPKEAKEGMTFYQAFVGKKGQAARPILQDGETKGLSINSITDGTSNTILVAEAVKAVEWTKPADIAFDNEGKAPKLGGHFEGGFNIALCDGSVRFLKANIDETLLKALITANGGEVVNLDD